MTATPSQAYWNQRHAIAKAKDRLQALSGAIGMPGDLRPFQWAQLYAMALEFRPDLVLELGRGHGNSTCVFTEAANRLGGCRVLSLDTDSAWRTKLPRLRRIVPEAWFTPLHAALADILAVDYAAVLAGARRVLVFWDAHGTEVAGCVLGGILPLLREKPHLVIMHDLSDARYSPLAAGKFRVGHVVSDVEQAIAVTDFAGSNALELHSADHDLHTHLAQRSAEMRGLLGEMFSLQAHWFYFTLNELRTAPRFPPFRKSGKSAARVRLADTLLRLRLWLGRARRRLLS